MIGLFGQPEFRCQRRHDRRGRSSLWTADGCNPAHVRRLRNRDAGIAADDGRVLASLGLILVTNEHFNTGLLHSLRGLLAPAASVILAAAAVYAVILHWL